MLVEGQSPWDWGPHFCSGQALTQLSCFVLLMFPSLCLLLLLLLFLKHLTSHKIHWHFLKINFIIFWPNCGACEILVPQPGMERMPPEVELHNHWTAREVSFLSY